MSENVWYKEGSSPTPPALIEALSVDVLSSDNKTKGGSFFAVHPSLTEKEGEDVYANVYFRESGSWNNWEADTYYGIARHSKLDGTGVNIDYPSWLYFKIKGHWMPNYRYFQERYEGADESVDDTRDVDKITSFIEWMITQEISENYREELNNIMEIDLSEKYILTEVIKYEYEPMFLLDSSAPNKYHKLKPYACFPSNEGDYSNVLFYNDTYSPETGGNLGWDYSQSNVITIPENTLIHNDANFIPDTDFALKELWKKKNKLNPFMWISKNFDLGNQTDTKLLSKIKIIYNNTPPSFEYMRNNDGIWRIPSIGGEDELGVSLHEDDGYCVTYRLPRELKKIKSIKVKLKSNLNPLSYNWDTEIDSFSIIYRERGRG
jgi:hypothetical protein